MMLESQILCLYTFSVCIYASICGCRQLWKFTIGHFSGGGVMEQHTLCPLPVAGGYHRVPGRHASPQEASKDASV